MKKLAIAVAAGVLLTGSAFADLCSCHNVATSHPILTGGAIRITTVNAYVKSVGSMTQYTLSRNGTLVMNTVDLGVATNVTFRLVAQDPDDDVCEPSIVAYAALAGSLNLSANGVPVPMKQASPGTWECNFVPTSKGIYRFSISGTITDKADQHASSNDPDLPVAGYASRLKVK